MIQGGCSPVGCVLIQLLKEWNASVTATCYKRALPVAKALGAADIIMLTEPSAVNNIFHVDNSHDSSSHDNLLKQLELRGDSFDVIFITNKNYTQNTDLTKFVNPNGLMFSTLPPALMSDSCGFITRFLLKWAISIRFLLQVSNFKLNFIITST